MDKLRIDSHKLMYHMDRVYEWQKGINIYPVYTEIGLFNGCNHRCVFCAFDYLNYQPRYLDTKYLKKFIRTAARKKIKSILYSGEGEPLLHPMAAEIISFTKSKGIDVALSTNGVLLTKKKAKEILPYLSWIRISLNAGTKKTYSLIHGTNENDFTTVLNNLKCAVLIKRKNKLNCTIGVQFLLMEQNYKDAIKITSILSNIGIDYLVFKPYSQHPLSKNKSKFIYNAEMLNKLKKRLEVHLNKNFNIIFRPTAFNKIQHDKTYNKCLGFSFITHIASSGDVYPCNAFVGNSELSFGSICKQSFEDIWEGSRRKKIIKTIYATHKLVNCRKSCRLDEINKYLWELRNPIKHINFI